MVVSRELYGKIIQELHSGPCSGHLGEDMPYEQTDVLHWCQEKVLPLRGLCRKNDVNTETLCPTSKQYSLSAGDYFTHWMEAYNISNQEVVAFTQRLVDELFSMFIFPQE